MKIGLNPEIRRALWVDFKPISILIPPVVLGLTFFCMVEILERNFLSTARLSLVIFFAVVCIYGCHAATNTLQDEVRNNTWDFQRMSVRRPFELAIGRIISSTLYAWYAGILCWCIFTYAYFNVPPKAAQAPIPLPHDGAIVSTATVEAARTRVADYFYITILAFLSGLSGQAASFLASCQTFSMMARRRDMARWRAGLGGTIVGVFVSGLTFFQLVMPMVEARLKLSNSTILYFLKYPDTLWWGYNIPVIFSIIICALLVTFWLWIGSWRLIKKELNHAVTTVAWGLFVATTALYYGGYIGDELIRARMMSIFVLAALYFSMIMDASDFDRYSRLFLSYRQKNIRGVFENMPLWLTTLPLAFLAIMAVITQSISNDAFKASTVIGFISLLLFIARDGLVIHISMLLLGWSNARFVLIFYYLLAYILLPLALVKKMNWSVKEQTIINGKNWFIPAASANIEQSILPALLQVSLLGFWLYRIIKSRQKA